MRRPHLFVLLALVLAATVWLPNGSAGAAASYTRAQLKSRADTIEFSYSLPTFMKVYKGTKSGIDTKLDWANYDGCSLPRQLKPIASYYDRLFTNACYRHDFGYRNYGNGLALGSSESYKTRIDKQFLAGMRYTCDHKVSSSGRQDCYDAAGLFYFGVSNFGKAQTAFFKRMCPSGRFCLFDDAYYADRRIALTSSVSNMNNVDFGDKTSSVINHSSYAWVIYDDSNYGDRRFCLPPGVSVRNWGVDAYKFNDKTSSAKKASGSKCPSGTPAISKG